MNNNNPNEDVQIDVSEETIIKTALKEYYERKYKLYRANTEMPVTDEEFETAKMKAKEIRAIKTVCDKFGV